MMNFLEKYRFKKDVFRLFKQHQSELIKDNGLEVELQPGAEDAVYRLGYAYCCQHNLHLSLIQKFRSYFDQWFEDLEVARSMSIW